MGSLHASLYHLLTSTGLPPLAADALLALAAALLLTNFAFINAGILSIVFRREMAFVQDRRGPNRVGPFGSLQWVADAIKLTLKQVMVPRSADRFLFLAAPVVAAFPFLMVYLVVPFGPDVQGADLNVGLLFVFAITGLSFPAFFMAGVSSNNKYAFLGGLRAVAQVIAFEIPLTLSALGVVLLTGSLRLSAIVTAQQGLWFVVPQAIGAAVFVIAGMAENAIHPFDLIEAESEIVTGYSTEYSSMLVGLFLAVETGTTFTLGAVFTTLFLGGWQPILPLGFVPPIVWFLLKSYAMFGLLALIRLSMPRFRIDQFLSLGWKILTPLAFINLLVAAAETTLFGRT